MDEELTEEDNSIPANPEVRNFSYTVVDNKIYYRENSRMTPVECSATAENRIKGMIAIRDSVRSLIEMQTADYPDYEVEKEQQKLNALYDNFSKKYGLINSRANVSAFSQDSSFALLSALEVLDENGELERKADMFTKRTIKPHTPVTSVDTASEALAVSMGEKAQVDMEYMCSLTGKTEQEIYEELKGVIFLNPMYGYGNSTERKYLMADEYLSGNVREKLAWAKKSAEVYPEDYKINVEALEKVQPKDLTASEIFVQLGTTWLPEEIAQQFMYEFLDTPRYAQWNIKVHYSKLTGEWNVEGKSYDRGNLKAYNTYGTKRVNAYKIIEDTLNMKDVRVFDYIEDDEGKKKAVLNKKETAIAQSKQELIKQGFQDWVWRDPARREKLVRLYNDKFNSIRPREYDGSHIIFSGMNPEIELREHQKNAVAHILYGGNTLLAHAVGAGKTFEMTAAAMESKRLGLCNKSLFVVPNHLTEQWAAEFLQLYPAANILVATKKDFEMKNRKRFCGRIATGDYDAVIIGHSQFEKIPISIERQRAVLQQQLDDIIEGIADIKRNRGDRFSVKQLEKTKKSLQTKLEMLRAAAIEDEEDNRPSPLDNLFADLEMDNPDHIALKYYRSYHSGSAKTLKSIQITLAARLEKFNLESLAALTSADELDLASMGEKKTALFALIPDNDSSFNFLVSILYTQLFQQLFYSADHIHGGSLPIPVHFLMDEFANVSLPDDFDKILSVMRSRGVSVSIILQNLAQLKALFEKQWESIVGNCDEFLYLGGNEQSTHKYVSELLGKETIDTNTYGKSEGRSGNYSTNYQISGRELLTPDEVRMLDNRYAILFIRGELPVMDLKYDILKHPNVAYTADGKGGVYQHGEVTKNVATIETLYVDLDSVPEMELSETTYELLSDEDFENLTN